MVVRPSRLLHMALVAMFALSAAACQLRVDVDVHVERDGAGALGVRVAADGELLDEARAAGGDPLAQLVDAGEDLARDGWQVRTAALDDGGREVVLRKTFARAEELEQLSRELAAGLAAPELTPLEPFSVTLTDDQVLVTGGAGLQPTDAVTEFGVQPHDAVRLLRETGAVDFRVHVHLPAEVLEATGEVEGQTVTWDVQPGERVDVRALARRPASPWWIFALAAAALVLLAVVVLRLRAKRRLRSRTAA